MCTYVYLVYMWLCSAMLSTGNTSGNQESMKNLKKLYLKSMGCDM